MNCKDNFRGTLSSHNLTHSSTKLYLKNKSQLSTSLSNCYVGNICKCKCKCNTLVLSTFLPENNKLNDNLFISQSIVPIPPLDSPTGYISNQDSPPI
jgi:hypothetical protein